MRARIASMVFQYSSISDAPRFVRLIEVRIFRSTISFLMTTRPVFSRFVSWTERFPLLNSVAFCRKTKSADAHEESTVRIANRAGSCTRRFGSDTVFCPSFIVVDLISPGQKANERQVIVQA